MPSLRSRFCLSRYTDRLVQFPSSRLKGYTTRLLFEPVQKITGLFAAIKRSIRYATMMEIVSAVSQDDDIDFNKRCNGERERSRRLSWGSTGAFPLTNLHRFPLHLIVDSNRGLLAIDALASAKGKAQSFPGGSHRSPLTLASAVGGGDCHVKNRDRQHS